MNNSNLLIYYSKENLTNRFVDYSNVFILPIICYFGIFTSFICLLVTFKNNEDSSKPNAKTLDYIFINSSIDFIFLVLQSFLFIIRCGALCPHGYTYTAKIYEYYIYLYVGYILVSSQVFLNIYVSFDRLKMFSAQKSKKKPMNIFKVYGICLGASILANAYPFLIFKQVVVFGIYMPNKNSTHYDLLYKTAVRKELDTSLFQNLLMANMVIKDPVMFCFLCAVAIVVCVRYRNYFKVRKNLIKTSPSSMILSFILCFLYQFVGVRSFVSYRKR